ncbi:MAG: hypothetical protein ABSG90_11500 [Dehalococcoidia bacterium]|jgi:3D (Asp-Asp-Asp) domain-containing protein
MKLWIIVLLTIIFYPATGQCQPAPTVICTAYCLKGHTTSGPATAEIHRKGGCIALSRKLAQDLGLKCGSGKYDYRFGVRVEVLTVGTFIFADLMPPKWKHYRVDIYFPTLHECHVFGVKRCQVTVVK